MQCHRYCFSQTLIKILSGIVRPDKGKILRDGKEININSEKSIVEFNYVGEDAIGTINGIEGKINFDISNSRSSTLLDSLIASSIIDLGRLEILEIGYTTRSLIKDLIWPI